MNEDSGLEFMRARFYDAESGRFVSEDPIGLSGNDLNLYRYVANEPIGRLDPLGLLFIRDDWFEGVGLGRDIATTRRACGHRKQ